MFRPRSKPAAAAHILALDLWPEAAYAVGDVHGCFDLYRALEAQIVADIARLGGIGLLVVLGDTIDRGPKSAEMIDHLIAPPPPGLMRVVLRGNHEEMFLRFLQAPERAASWLRHGGLETLASYGIDTAPFERGTLTPRRMQNVLETMVPPEHRQFLAALPDAFILPPFMFTHAGVDPARSPEQQSARDLRWGANVSASALDDGAFPLKVVHGHTPCAGGTALIEPGRINLDTGAYVSGKLTAARFLRDGSVGLFEQTRV
jgi:serine/threonine protein phosphatase 1